MAHELLGRAEEVAAGRRFLEAAASGPACLVIEGEPGVGKSSLWQAIVDEAAASGFRILASRPSELETDLSHASLTDLLHPVADEIRPILPPPQRRAVDTALLMADAQTGAGDLRALGTAFHSALRHLAAQGPVIVAVDDLQWTDTASARALSFAARRLANERVGFLVVRRSAPLIPVTGDLQRAFAPGRVEVVTLAPMSLGAMHRLIESRFGVSLPRPSLIHLQRASGGIPLLALDIIDSLRRAGRPMSPQAIVPVPAEISRMVAGRMDALPASTRRVVVAIAALGRPRIALLRSVLGGRDVKARLTPAIDEGLVELDSDRVRFVHPLYRSAVYGAEPQDRLRGLHRRISEELTDAEESALHLAMSVAGPDGSIANTVAETAAELHRRGAVDGAAVLYDHALRLTPAEDSQPHIDRALALARILWELGDIDRSRALTSEALSATPRGPARALALLLEAMHRLWTTGSTAAMPLYLEALACASGDPELEATIHLRIAYASDEDLSRAARHARAAGDLLHGRPGAEDLLACALLMSVEFALMAGDPYDGATAARGRAVLEGAPRPVDPRTAFDARAVAQERSWLLRAATDDLVEARRELEEVRRSSADRGLDRAAPIIHMDIAELSCQLGDLDAAKDHAEQATQLAARTGRLPYAAAAARFASAVAAEHSGDLGVAGELAREARDMAGALGDSPLLDRTTVLLARIKLWQGDPAAAARQLLTVDARLEAAGMRHPAAHRFRGDLIEALVIGGRVEEAAAHASRFKAGVEASPTPWGHAIAARSRALVAAAYADLGVAVRELEIALTHHQDLPMPVERGRTLMHLGRVLRRRRQKRPAVEAFTSALKLFEAAGAAKWAADARHEMERIGSRRSSADELTRTELEVARLAAAGMTNRQVADAMVLSPKSVDGVLTRVYAKLDIHSRAELGGWIARDSTRKEG